MNVIRTMDARDTMEYKIVRTAGGWLFETDDGRMVCVSLEAAKIAAEMMRKKDRDEEIVPSEMRSNRALNAERDRELEKVLRNPPQHDVAVVVVDESLLDDGKFEIGVTYVMEELKPREKDVIWVYDKFGEKRQYFRSRFKVVFE